MKSKTIVLFTAVLLGSLSLSAHTLAQADEQILQDVTANISGILSEDVPFAVYQKAIENIQEPSYENLQPLFKDLTVLNKIFQSGTNFTNNKLAVKLNQAVKVGWNTFRQVNMLEIFKNYFPQENQDKDIALLEYNIKINLLSLTKQSEILLFQDTKNTAVKQLYSAYTQFTENLENAAAYNPQDIAVSFVNLIKDCNTAEEAQPGITKLAKDMLFTRPILAGWGRTVTAAEIKSKLGMEKDPAGDGVYLYPAEKLQELYALSAEDAALMADFVKRYNID